MTVLKKFSLSALLLTSGLVFARGQQKKSQPENNLANWATPAELSNYKTTPRYDETMAYVRRVAAAAPRQVRVESFGKTPEGRDLVLVIVSRDGLFDPAALHKANRPIVLLQNAIHAGEMDGKDSCLALLRDMVISKTQASLLDRAVVLIMPIYNADGHERFGQYNRINQNGPEQMGWRTQSQNLNLNRDYMKADAPETRAFLRLWDRWLPDFYVDNHVTDGSDYQYDTTYSLETGPNMDPALAKWQGEILAPYLEKSVAAAGHLISPYIELADSEDPSKGVVVFPSSPRFSTGYAAVQNRPAMLVEMHMLKDYQTRVTGNYEILRALLEVVNRDADKVIAMNRAADAATIAMGAHYNPAARVALETAAAGTSGPFQYLGYQYTRSLSPISGGVRIEYSHEPVTMEVPRQVELKAVRSVAPPQAYIVPAQWTSVIDVLTAHGVQMQKTTAAWEKELDTYRCKPAWQERPFEGRHPVAGSGELGRSGAKEPMCKPVHEKLAFPAGSVVVPMAQRAAKVAIGFLEPEAPDSAVTWGFFDAIFEQKEYGEAYVLEKLAQEMMAKDPALKHEFEEKIAADPQFAANPYARLNFFYQRSPWWDPRLGLYPVGRLNSVEGVPVSSAKP